MPPSESATNLCEHWDYITKKNLKKRKVYKPLGRNYV